jgi:uncharacterized membrane protein YobD (UPF0266 family)
MQVKSILKVCLRNKDQQDALFFLNLFSIIYPLHVSNRVTIHHQTAVTVHAAYGIYHASALTSC